MTPDRSHSHPQNTHEQGSGQPSALEQAYLTTSYLVHAPAGRLVIRIGLLHPEVDRLLSEQDSPTWAYITAHNPGSVLFPEEDNQRRQRYLEEDVSRAGWRYFPGEGLGASGTWPAEKSLLILGIRQEDALELAERHGQAALVYGERGQPAQLLWTPITTLEPRR